LGNIVFLERCNYIVENNFEYKKRMITWLYDFESYSDFEKIEDIKSFNDLEKLFISIEKLIDRDTKAIIDISLVYYNYGEEFKRRLIDLLKKYDLKLFMFVPCMFLRTLRDKNITKCYDELKKELGNEIIMFRDDREVLDNKYKNNVIEKVKENEKNYINFVLNNIKLIKE
jgi:hypothetical protein